MPGDTPRQTERQAARFSKEHVFVTRANTPLDNNLLTRFYAVCEKAGIEDAKTGGKVDLHSLRVSFITLSMEHGGNPRAIQALVGHKSLEMTMKVYAKATDKSWTRRARSSGIAPCGEHSETHNPLVVGSIPTGPISQCD